jgi:hypothetical protein
MEQGEEGAGRARDTLEAAAGAAADATGGLVGLGAATRLGPAGGVVIAAATAETLRYLATHAIGLRDSQAGRTLELAARQANLGLEELQRRLAGSPHRLQLTAAALAAAANTTLEAKLRALGRALATGALTTDDAVIDEQRFLVDTLADLEAPHLRVLHQLSIEHEGYWPEVYAPGQEGAHGWSLRDLADSLPGQEAVLEPILSVLAGHALALDTADGTLEYRLEGRRWVVTDYGKRCLAELEAIGQQGAA